MMDHQGNADQWAPDEWLQANTGRRENDNQSECSSTKQQETRSWHRTVLVPEAMQPGDLITAYPFEFPFPPFHAGQMGVNKHDVECIASAMADPSLRWRKMCHFLIAPYEVDLSKGGDVPVADVGDHVLLTGHHRFLAFLLCGIPLSDLPPIQISVAPMGVPYATPWPVVEWGA